MKNLIYTIVLIFCFLSYTKAQEEEKSIDLTQIKTPNSPAAVIIDNQISAINKPKSWNSLEANIYSNFLSQEGTLNIPNDYAIEFSPYWAHKDLSLSNNEFLRPTIKKTLIQNLSFSLSSTQNYLLKDSLASNAVGFGIRTMIWQGSKEEGTIIIEKYNELLVGLKQLNFLYMLAGKVDSSNCSRGQIIEKYIELIIEKADVIFKQHIDNNEISSFFNEYRSYLIENLYYSNNHDNFSDSVEVLNDEFFKIDSKVIDLAKLRSDRKGFKLELATAMSLNFPTNEVDFSIVPKFGVWLTPSYQPYKTEWIEFLGVIRYYNYNLDFYKDYLGNQEEYSHTFDYGLRLAFKWKKYSIEFEGVGRAAQTLISEGIDENGIRTKTTRNKSDFQYILNFNYQIKDNMYLTYNFGKSFDPVLNYNGNIISLLTLNFAFDTPDSGIIK